MILPDFVIPNRANRTLLETGIDSLEQCNNKKWFINYPYSVTYHYNSRGFRDTEWPEDLNLAIWCFGDSFTVGLGNPTEHTWPYILEKETGIRCINISLDGASNDWMPSLF